MKKIEWAHTFKTAKEIFEYFIEWKSHKNELGIVGIVNVGDVESDDEKFGWSQMGIARISRVDFGKSLGLNKDTGRYVMPFEDDVFVVNKQVILYPTYLVIIITDEWRKVMELEYGEYPKRIVISSYVQYNNEELSMMGVN